VVAVRVAVVVFAAVLGVVAGAPSNELVPSTAPSPHEQGRGRSVLLDVDDSAWSVEAPAVFRARFATSKGDFVIEVHRDWAPVGADRFFNLVRFGYYDDTRVSRVRAGRFTQFGLSGDPAVNAVWYGRTMPDDPVVKSNLRGTVAYAMRGLDDRTTQVFVNMRDNPDYDAQGFAPIGRVIEGMDVVESFYSEYGEEAGGGVRAGNQGPVVRGGNAYLDAEFPLLDRIFTATIE